MIFLCPSDCPHPFDFSHSIVTTVRATKNERVTRTFIVCRDCGHWIIRQPRCGCPCHETPGGYSVKREKLVIESN